MGGGRAISGCNGGKLWMGLAGLLVTGWALLFPALFPASAKSAWLPASSLTQAGQNALEPQVAIGPNGLTTVVWTRQTNSGRIVETATRLPGEEGFSTPVDLTPLAGGDVSGPELAIGPDGTTTVVYSLNDSGQELLGVKTRPAGSATFSDSIGPASGADSYLPDVAIGPDRATTLIWEGIVSAQYRVITATRAAGQGSYSSPVPVSTGLGTEGSVTAGADGILNFAYLLSSSEDLVQVAQTTAGGGFTYSTLSASGQNASQPQIATGPDGTTAVVWRRWNGSAEITQASLRGPHPDSFRPAADLSLPGATTYSPQVAVGPGGLVTAVWTRQSGSETVIQSATRVAGANGFTEPVTLSQSGANASNPQVAIAPDGKTTAVWQRGEGSGNVVQAATRAAGATGFSEPVTLSQVSQAATFPRVGAATSGDPCSTFTTAVWPQSGASDSVVQQASEPIADCPDPGRASLGPLKVKGPVRAKKGKKTTYRVSVINAGTASATGLKLKAKGKGVSASKSAGSLAAGASKTVKLPVRFRKQGKVRVTFTLASNNAGKKTVKKSVRVR